MNKKINTFAAFKSPDEIHAIILTEENFCSVLLKKIDKKRSVKSVLCGLVGGSIFPLETGSILSSLNMRQKIEKFSDIDNLPVDSACYKWSDINKVSLSSMENMLKLKTQGTTVKYFLSDDDFDEIKKFLYENIRIKNKK